MSLNENIDFSVPLPDYSIRRIIFSENSVLLLCSMNRPVQERKSSWFQSSKFYKYMKVYFSVCESLSQEHVNKYFYPEHRVTEWSSFLQLAPGQWDDCFTPQDADPNRPTIFGTVETSLEELLQTRQLIEQNLFSSMVDDAITQESILGDNSRNDHYFEVEIPFDIRSLKNIRHPYEVNEIDVFSMMHLDIDQLKSDLGLSWDHSTQQIFSIGGSFKYENCLRRNPETGDLSKIETIPVFFKQDGTPYSGYAHFHRAEDNEAGYSGWMSGPSIGAMHGGLRDLLSVREIRNSKVVFNLEHSPLSFDGTSLGENNAYDGSDMAQQFGLGVLRASEMDNLSIGEDLIQYVRAQIGQINLIGEIGTNLYNQQLKKAALGSIRNSKFSLCDGGALNLSWIEAPPAVERGSHVSAFVLNADDILIYNSKYGNILSNILNNTPREIHREIVDDIMDRSIFYDFKVKRRRVTELPVSNNYSSTGRRDKHDLNEPDKLLIRTKSDFGADLENLNTGGFSFQTAISAPLTPGIHSLAKIEELGHLTDDYKKIVILRDYELYDSISFGTYDYVIDVVLIDGIRSYLIDMFNRYKNALSIYREYVRTASMPYLDRTQSGYYVGHQFENPFVDDADREELRTSGNYIVSQDRFTENFKDTVFRNRRSLIDEIVDVYHEALVVFGVTPFSRDFLDPEVGRLFLLKEFLKSALLPSEANLKTLEFFEKLFLLTGDVIRKNIFLKSDELHDAFAIDNRRPIVKKDISYPPEIISLSTVANSPVTAIPKRAVLVQPAIDASLDIEIRRMEVQPQVPLGAVSVFTIPEFDPSQQVLSRNVDGSLSVLPPEMEVLTLYSNTGTATALSIEENRNTISFRIDAAIAASLSNTPLWMMTEENLTDDLFQFNQVLNRYGGITFNSMASRAILISPEEDQVHKDFDINHQDVHMSRKMQSAVLSNIIKSETKREFINQMEEDYRDIYYTKQGLGNLYSAVKGVLLTERSRQLNIQLPSNTTFKEMVRSGTKLEQNKERKINNLMSQNSKNGMLDTVFKAHSYVEGSGLHLGVLSNSSILVYYPDEDLREGAYLVNNVLLLDRTQVSRGGLTSGASRVSGTRSLQGAGNNAQTSGASSAGSSSGAASQSSGY